MGDTPAHPDPDKDEPVKVPLDPEAALRALMHVRPDSATTTLMNYSMKKVNGNWVAYPNATGPLRFAHDKGWQLIVDIRAEGGSVSWASMDDVKDFEGTFGPAPSEELVAELIRQAQ